MIGGIEIVNGTVIGPCTITASVHSPRGTQQGNPRQFETETDARAWAEDVRRKAMAEVGSAECERLGWNGQWEMRVRD